MTQLLPRDKLTVCQDCEGCTSTVEELYRMAEQVPTNGFHEGEGVVHADVGPEVTILNSSDARTQESLKQANATIRRLTTADMKPVETFRSMDVGSPLLLLHE